MPQKFTLCEPTFCSFPNRTCAAHVEYSNCTCAAHVQHISTYSHYAPYITSNIPRLMRLTRSKNLNKNFLLFTYRIYC